LSDFDPELRPTSLKPASGAFVDHVPHTLEELGPVLHQPADAEKVASLFISGRHEDDITIQRHLRSVERHKRGKVQNPARLHQDAAQRARGLQKITVGGVMDGLGSDFLSLRSRNSS
jgi:hypothetical protein